MPTRASDSDRERCAEQLRDHAAAGRLELEELEQRLARVYGARYRAELRAALRDLPREHGRRIARAADRIDRAVLRAHAGSFALVSTLLVVLWALTGGSFWPVYVMVPWAIVLAWHAAGSWSVRRMLRRRARRELPPGDDRRRLTA